MVATMLGIVFHFPSFITTYLSSYSAPEIASHALLFLGWIPIFGVIIWGGTQVWIDFKQGQYFNHIHWILLNISIPAGAINTPKGMENFFNNLAGSKSAITWKESHLEGKFQAYFSLEIVGSNGGVEFYIRCPDKYKDLVEPALYAQYPEAQITEVPDYIDAIPDKYPNDTHKVFGSEMILQKPSHYPLRTYLSFEHQGEKDFRFKDPLLNIIELMGKMGKGEHLWLQIIIMQPDEQTWAKEGEKYLNKIMGKEEPKPKPGIIGSVASALGSLPAEALKQATGVAIGGAAEEGHKEDDFRMFKLTPTERAFADAIAEKISKIGWYTKIRVMYIGPKERYRKPLMASAIKGMFHPFAHLNMNKLGLHNPATPKDDYFWMVWQMYYKMTRLVGRYKLRALGAGAPPFILNAEELATLFHFPASDARTPILTNIGARRGEAPNTLPFASVGSPDLPDWKQLLKAKDAGHDAIADESMLGVPTPTMEVKSHVQTLQSKTYNLPTSKNDFMPQPGRPAPLPPGLDLSLEPLTDTSDAPPNLPVL